MSVTRVNTAPKALIRFFQEYPRVALAFSGGADSSWLLHAARACDACVCAYYVATELQPAFALMDARGLCAAHQVGLTTISLHLLKNERIAANRPDRCYHCKRMMLEAVRAQAASDGFTVLIDGSNASDDAANRPGMRALEELGVRSPLRDAGMTKKDVRLFSRHCGLPTWNKPAHACLATRFATGMEVTVDHLRRVERAEHALAQIGLTDFRVRVRGRTAVLQVIREHLASAMQRRKEIAQILKMDFQNVWLDLRPRKSVAEELDE